MFALALLVDSDHCHVDSTVVRHCNTHPSPHQPQAKQDPLLLSTSIDSKYVQSILNEIATKKMQAINVAQTQNEQLITKQPNQHRF